VDTRSSVLGPFAQDVTPDNLNGLLGVLLNQNRLGVAHGKTDRLEQLLVLDIPRVISKVMGKLIPQPCVGVASATTACIERLHHLVAAVVQFGLLHLRML